MKKPVPVIISCDIDPSPEVNVSERNKAFSMTGELFARFGIKATLFCVGEVAGRFPEAIKALAADGHEIGCHGLNHDETDEYNTLPEDEQRDRLGRATEMITKVTGRPVFSFRGPRVKTSVVTQSILSELGCKVDSSVCSQRLDFLSSNLINPGWIFAPRLPYHPSGSSPYRKGNRPLLVIPVSALMLPFLSGVLYTFGLYFTRFLFNVLYLESLLTGKPIVYLMHPAEFARKTEEKRKDFSLKVEGVKFRRSSLIFEQDIQKRYILHEKLFSSIAAKKNIEFMTMMEYEKRYA